MRLQLSRLHFPVTTLGVGRRIGVWFQGCSIRCPGCVSLDTWDPAHGTTTVEDVVTAIGPWLEAADGLTVSGGTPPYQFSWSNGLLNEDISSLFIGPYSVSITDANGCSLVENTTVTAVGDMAASKSLMPC